MYVLVQTCMDAFREGYALMWTCIGAVPGVPEGAEIDGGGTTQLFSVDGATLHLQSMDLSRAATNASGAAVSAADGSFVSVHGCTFSANIAPDGGGGETHHKTR